MPQYDFRVERTIKNLVWVPQLSQRDNIPTKSGPIPKSQFSSDTIMVSSEHAVLDLRDEVQPIIRNLAKIVVPLLYAKNNF